MDASGGAICAARESDLPSDGMLAFVRAPPRVMPCRAAGGICSVHADCAAQEAQGRSLLLVRHRDELHCIDAHCFHMARLPPSCAAPVPPPLP